MPDIVVGRLFDHLGEREGAQGTAPELHQPRFGDDLQPQRLGARLCRLLGTHGRARDDAVGTIAAHREGRAELAGLGLSRLGQGVLGRPAMVGAARRVAVAGEQEARVHGVSRSLVGRRGANAIAAARIRPLSG